MRAAFDGYLAGFVAGWERGHGEPSLSLTGPRAGESPIHDSIRSAIPRRPGPETLACNQGFQDDRTSCNIVHRANAQKSTGPRTLEGKAASRANAMIHGFCAEVIDIPGEDPAILPARETLWQADLNPTGRAAQGYLIHQAVRRSGRLDRLDTVYNAHVARLKRDAIKARHESRMREVEELTRMLWTDCDIAARRLRLTPEGCDFLIKEWDGLRISLVPPTHFDGQEEGIMIQLLGGLGAYLLKSPSPFGLAIRAMILHREIAEKLAINENPDALMWQLRYRNDEQHERDKARIGTLTVKAEAARLEIIGVINQATADLRVHKAQLEFDDSIRQVEETLRAGFDASDEGKLIHRYEIETERSLLRCLKEVRDLNTHDEKMAQAKTRSEVEANRPSATPTANPIQPARNEPTDAGEDNPFQDLKERVVPGISSIPVFGIAKTRPNHRR